MILNYTDGYKLDHRRQYPKGVTKVYGNWTPRGSRRNCKSVVLFGPQFFIKEYLIKEFNEFFTSDINIVCTKYLRRINNYLGPNGIGDTHIRALHALGYVPLLIKALPEGTVTRVRVPQVTIQSTHDDFSWLVNYIETLFSCTVWMPSTNATIAKEYREIFDEWCEKTGGNSEDVQFQGHDFSFRGMPGIEAAKISGAAHLLSFTGTDTVPAIDFLEEHYCANSDKEVVGCGVAATEHAVMCTGIGFYIQKDHNGDWTHIGKAEKSVFLRLITEIYPTGIISIVSDTMDLWKVISEFLVDLKDVILARDGKLVIRPDSGDPVKIITGYTPEEMVREGADFVIVEGKYITLEGKHISDYEYRGVAQCLWDIFGGTFNEKGYKVLNPKIGVIYGDSITTDRATAICSRLADRNFVSTSWVAGIGSFTYQYNTRDTFGFAMKATYAEVLINNINTPLEIFKDPVTDDGTKKSARGLLQVAIDKGEFILRQQVSIEEEQEGELLEVFKDGKLLIEYSLSDIRATMRKYKLQYAT